MLCTHFCEAFCKFTFGQDTHSKRKEETSTANAKSHKYKVEIYNTKCEIYIKKCMKYFYNDTQYIKHQQYNKTSSGNTYTKPKGKKITYNTVYTSTHFQLARFCATCQINCALKSRRKKINATRLKFILIKGLFSSSPRLFQVNVSCMNSQLRFCAL